MFLLSSTDFFPKIDFYKNIFQEHYQSVKWVDSNCSQRLSADEKSRIT